MVLQVFTSFLGGVPLCIPYGLYIGTSLGGTTQGTLEGYPGRVLSKIDTFYNKQLKRDEDVLTFLEKREGRMEASMLQKAEGFKYLYKE